MFVSEQQTISSPFIQKKPQSREHLSSPIWCLHDLSSDPCFSSSVLHSHLTGFALAIPPPPRPNSPITGGLPLIQEPSTDTTVSRRGLGTHSSHKCLLTGKETFPRSFHFSFSLYVSKARILSPAYWQEDWSREACV